MGAWRGCRSRGKEMLQGVADWPRPQKGYAGVVTSPVCGSTRMGMAANG